MNDSTTPPPHVRNSRPEDFWALARRIAKIGTQGITRIEFLRATSDALFDFTRCDCIDFWVTDAEQDYRCQRTSNPGSSIRLESIGPRRTVHIDDEERRQTGLARSIAELMSALATSDPPDRVIPASFLAHDAATRARLQSSTERLIAPTIAPDEWASILLLALEIEFPFSGLVIIRSRFESSVLGAESFLYEQVAAGIGRAIANRRAQFRLRERIKELTCLHGLARVVQRNDPSLETALQSAVDLLPAAMQFPEIAAARATVDGRTFQTSNFAPGRHRIAAPIDVNQRDRGNVEIAYLADHPEFAAGSFLIEEQSLIESVARELALLVERSDAASSKAALAEQLRHADRLATIGQLAAGVAHELNEPLTNILGFAQLLTKSPDVPADPRRDVDQIVKASMHAREIVRKLLVFARQTQPQRINVDLSELIRESLYFLEARCRRSEIDLRLDLASTPSIVSADPSQMTQVFVNLTVNAIQAMGSGGVLTVRTINDADSVVLDVEDTGIGMNEATRQRLFTPFFTTKDVGEGTGLGLSVVLGIVASHGGTVHVESDLGRGAKFRIVLPRARNGESPPAEPGVV